MARDNQVTRGNLPANPDRSVEQKEQFFELSDGRVVFKFRTQMQFSFGRSELVAVGAASTTPSRASIFISSQYISRRLHHGWSLCHAAGVAHAGVTSASRHGLRSPERQRALAAQPREELEQRSDLLDLIMKSPGVFHRDELGHGTSEAARPDPSSHLQVARGLPVWEAKAAPNFELAVRFCRRTLEA